MRTVDQMVGRTSIGGRCLIKSTESNKSIDSPNQIFKQIIVKFKTKLNTNINFKIF